ncbi:MAG: glycoside hydrolase family 95 protein, partial [Bacteroidota bacterium]|nr:glycoside hydrolase family 95 protein [Bacteroidota bacterium]
MKSTFQIILLMLLFVQFTVSSSFGQESASNNINWNKFLSAHDLIFDKMPESWQEAPYFGNGFIGSMIYGDTANRNQIKIQAFRTDVQDHRNDSSGWTAYSRPRLPIGYFTITLKGKIKNCHLRMHLFTADITGNIVTTEGSISLHHFVSAQKDLIFTKIITHGNEKYSLSWHPVEAKSTRVRLFPNSEKVIPFFAKAYGEKYNQILKVYVPNPPVEIKQTKNISLSVQNLLYGGQYVVAWKEEKLSSNTNIFIATIKNSYPANNAQTNAENLISSTSSNSFDKNYKEHIAWWDHFYRKSFLTIPDKEMEGFYWLQMYKLGCA